MMYYMRETKNTLPCSPLVESGKLYGYDSKKARDFAISQDAQHREAMKKSEIGECYFSADVKEREASRDNEYGKCYVFM